jgi:8-oxo-dGTP diphosphatase
MLVEKALHILKKKPINNISIIYTIENDPQSIQDLEVIDNSVFLRKKPIDGWIMISSPNEPELNKVLDNYIKKDDKSFAGIDKWIADKIISMNKNDVEWKETTYRFYLPKNISLPKIKSIIRPLKEEDTPLVNEYWEYKNEDSIHYIKDMIIKNHSGGIEEDEKLVAWLTIHDDGALGFLYVLEGYRGKGYAKDLTIYLCNKLREEHKIPFLYIVTENDKSLNLAQTLGFIKDGKVCWFSLK